MKFYLTVFAAALCAFPAHAQINGGTTVVSPTPQATSIPGKLLEPRSGQDATLVTRGSRYTLGQTVAMQFIVANRSDKSVAYNFLSGQQFDITATDKTGKTVWTWSKGRTFASRISRLALPPKQRRVFVAAWQGKGDDGKLLPPGAYKISATMTSTNRPAITGSFVVGTDTDPHNMGMATRTPADNGAVRQVNVLPPLSADTTITLLPAPK